MPNVFLVFLTIIAFVVIVLFTLSALVIFLSAAVGENDFTEDLGDADVRQDNRN